jgi:hypothetical protein
MEPEVKIGQCPRCLARDADQNEKKLFRCSLCGVWYCEKHVLPKSCYIVDLGKPDKDPTKWQYLNDDDSGHPDAKFIEKQRLSPVSIPLTPTKETELPEPPVTIPIQSGETRSRTFGTCPKCKCTDSDIIKDYPHKAILKCWNCHLKYGQRKYSPYHYIHLRKRRANPKRPQRTRQQPISMSDDRPPVPRLVNPKKKKSANTAVIAGAVIVSLLVIVFFSGALSYFNSQTQSPTPSLMPSSVFSPVASPVSSPNTPPVSSPVTQQNLLVNPKTMHYNYTLRGVSSELSFTVYGGMYDYLTSHEDSTVHSSFGQQPSSEEVSRIVTLRYVNESIEQGELQNLVNSIKQLTPNEDDQARIAISLVQNIPYDWNSFESNNIQAKYPYEVLYSNTGVCGQKSLLLACLLRDLGYGCSIFEFPNHAAVGITCPSQYAYNSGYAFVESTSPTIITDSYGDYVGAGKLPSSPSYIIAIQEGKVMVSVSEEYQDCQTYQSLINMGPVLDESHYNQWQSLVSKYGIHVS